MPQNLLSEFTTIYVARGDELAPPYVARTSDRDRAQQEALDWAQRTFGEGDYRAVAGRFVGRMQGYSWGQIPTW